ncbi:MAG: SGNH/GDSL hydrolase family protein [Gemmobacter sp.]
MTRTLLIYGDSNSHGTPPMPHLDFVGRHAPPDRWPGVLAADLPDWTVIAEGLPGRSTVHDDPLEGAHKNGLTILPAILETHTPLDLVIVKLGTNDLKARYALPAQDIAFGAGRLIDCIRHLEPAAKVLLIAPPPVTESGCLAEMFGGGAAKSARFAALYAAEAQRKGAAFLDAGAHIAVDPVDGIHYDAPAHHRLGRAVAAAIRRLWP